MTYVSTENREPPASAPSDIQQDNKESSPGNRAWALVTLAAVGGLAGLVFWSAPAPMVAPWDVFILLDGAYRMTEGQVPGTDFSNPIGPLLYGLISLGMDLQAVPSLAAVTYGSLIFLALISPLAWGVARSRLPAMYSAAFTIFVALTVVSVRPLGYSPWTTTYAMLYNRFGWVLYSVLLLLVLLRPRRVATSATLVAQGLVVGVLLGLLFYCKINFCLAAMVAVAVGFALSTLPRRVHLGLSIVPGFLAVAVLMRLLFGVRIGDYAGDLMDAARAQEGGQRFGLLVDRVVDSAPVGLLSVVLVAGLFVAAHRSGEVTRPLWRPAVAMGFVLGSSVLIAAGNAPEQADLPALVVAPLVLIASFAPRLPGWAGGSPKPSGQGGLPQLFLAGLAALLIITTGPIAAKDALGLGKSVALRGYVAAPPESQRLSGERLRDFVIPADSQWQTAYRTAHTVSQMIDNGLLLLRQHISPGDTVFTMALTDPFSFPLALPSTRGGPLWWDLGFNFDRNTHPDPGQVLGSARWVMIPRMLPGEGCCQETVRVMREMYGTYLAQNFTETARNADWILLNRMPAE